MLVFLKEKWKSVTKFAGNGLSIVSNLPNSLANYLEAKLNKHPIPARIATKLGINPVKLIPVLQRWSAEKIKNNGGRLINALKDTGKGCFSVVKTAPKTFYAIMDKELRPHFVRGVKRNLILILTGTVFLAGTVFLEWIHKNFLITAEESDNSYGKEFYAMIGMNLFILYKFNLMSNLISYTIDDMLDNSVISDRASQLSLCPDISTDFKDEINHHNSLHSQIRNQVPIHIKNLVRTKIFTSTEATIKDKSIEILLFANNLLLKSSFINIVGWFIRAYIFGNDLALSQLSSKNLPDIYQRNIQGNRNFRSLGEGIVFFGIQDSALWLLYKYTNLGYFPIVNLPITCALSSLLYKFSIVSTFMKEIEVNGYKKNGVNLDTVYKLLIVDPILDLGEENVKAILKEDVKQNHMPNHTKEYDQKSEQESNALFENLSNLVLNPSRRAFLQMHAENIIFCLSTLKTSRSYGSVSFIKFVSIFFPKKVYSIVNVFLNELTDAKIDQIITFLLIHQDNLLKDDIDWTSVESRENLYEIRPIHAGVTRSLNSVSRILVSAHEMDNVEDEYKTANDPSDDEARSVTHHQYDQERNLEASKEVNELSQNIRDTFNIKVQQFLRGLKKWQNFDSSQLKDIAEGFGNATKALKDTVDATPAGPILLKAAAIAPAVLFSGPAGACISVAAGIAHTAYSNSGEIMVGTALTKNVIENYVALK